MEMEEDSSSITGLNRFHSHSMEEDEQDEYD